MPFLKELKMPCPEGCGSKIYLSKRGQHVCPSKKDHADDSGPNPAIVHESRRRKRNPSKDCLCNGNNPNCLLCIGTGRISNRALVPEKPIATVQGTPTINLGHIPDSGEAPVPRVKHISKRKSKKNAKEELPIETETRYESPSDVRNMDHAKPYAHAFRDGGQFGSYPSIDGFDDESKP